VVTFTVWDAQPAGTYIPLCYTNLAGAEFRPYDTARGFFIVIPPGTPPQIQSISPNGGGDIGMVLVEILGDYFQEGLEVRLTKSGRTDIVADSLDTYFKDSTQISTILDLEGAETGLWNLVIMNPDGGSGTCYDCFNIEPGYTHGLSQEGQFVQEGLQVVDFIDNVEYVPDVNTN